MQDLLTQPVVKRLADYLSLAEATLGGMFTLPAKGVAGDLALPCFQPAKAKGKPPPAMATELAAMVNAAAIGIQATAVGPFLNLTWTPAGVATALLPELSRDPLQALRSTVGVGKTVCVDFSSPNIAKHMAFHHIRSTMIGNALARCYATAGWKTVRINFLGDWGTAFGRLIAGWKRENLSLAALEQVSDKVGFLNNLYVRISRLEKEDPAIEEEARFWSRKCEEGDQ